MALSILDGNQSATTLSTILSSGQHITAHTVVSLGTQAITDMRGAVSGSVVSISNFPATQPVSIASVTVGNTVTIAGTVTANGGDFASPPLGAYPAKALRIGFVDDEQYNAVGIASGGKPLPITLYDNQQNVLGGTSNGMIPLAISGTVTVGSALPAGTNRIGVVTIGGGTVTIGAGTAQIGSVTASISGTVPVSGTFFQATQPVSLTTLPALVAGTAQIGSVTASISGTVPISITSVTIGSCVTHGVTIANTVVTFYPMQGTTVTNSNFTSTTASTTLVSAVANREVLTVFNEGAGNLHISPGATCTTVAYQVRLSSGDYWECPQGQLSLAHTAVFATAGTARVTQVS